MLRPSRVVTVGTSFLTKGARGTAPGAFCCLGSSFVTACLLQYPNHDYSAKSSTSFRDRPTQTVVSPTQGVLTDLIGALK